MWTHSERFLTITSRSLIMMFRCGGSGGGHSVEALSLTAHRRSPWAGVEGSTHWLCEQLGTLSQALPPLSWYTSGTHLALQCSDRSQILPAPLGPVISQPHSQSRWQVTWDRVSGFTCMVEPTALGRSMPCQLPLGGKERKGGGGCSQPASPPLPLAASPRAPSPSPAGNSPLGQVWTLTTIPCKESQVLGHPEVGSRLPHLNCTHTQALN